MRAASVTLIALCGAILSGCGSSSSPSFGAGGTQSGEPGDVSIRVLSNRADLVSGDDALVEVVLPAQTDVNAVLIDVDGRDVKAAFKRSADGRFLGLLTGLALGTNKLTARLPGGGSVSADIVNHPNSGPVFAGPQIQPWVCQGGAVDAQCNQPAEYTFLYKSTDPTKYDLQPYDPASPPADVATTTTENGQTLPFIVRQERGYQARDEYKILMLFQLDQPWEASAPQEQWNHKLLVTHGGGCGTAHAAGGAPLADYSGTFSDVPAITNSYVTALGLGFGVMSTALDNLGHNCNLITAAESLMMAKERLIEQYGELRYTVGTGCSGGSITQQHVANAYPGIYNGLITTCAYPDTFTTGAQFFDYHLLRLYFEPNPQNGQLRWGPGIVWTPQQMADVEGHASHVNAITTNELFFKSVTSPTSACDGVSDAERYNPDTNPGGVRCGLLDYLINMLGPRPPEVWGPQEQQVGHGFGGNFLDNVGIQYGLEALQQLRITPAQFVDLNEKIGGVNIDVLPVPERVAADRTALANGYRAGGVNSTNNMKYVAIINATGPDPGAAHDTVHAWWTRWRLDREQGHHDNHVMWGGPAPLIGDPNYMNQALVAMDRWLAAVEQDASATPLPQKIIANKPADVHDQCSDGLGHKLLDEICPEQIQGRFTSPRVVAGGPDADDTIKCTLKPLNRADDYGPLGELTFTEDEWARLEALYAGGVCDYGVAGVEQQGTVPWLTYQDAVGGVIYGGTALPPVPADSQMWWASPALRVAP